MAVATGTAALIGGGLTALGAFGGAKVQANTNKHAINAQSRAQADALAYERQRQALEDERYQQRWQDYQRRHAAWEARNFGGGGAPAGGRPPARRVGGVSGAPAGAPVESGARLTLADMIGMGAQGAGPVMAGQGAAPMQGQPRNIGEMAGWSDWRNYGVGA